MIPSAWFWDRYAAAYDALMGFHPYAHLIDHVSDLALSGSPTWVLDLGCGTGNVTAALVKKDPSVHVDAVDWSPVMLRRLTGKVPPDRVESVESDILQHLECTDRRYDAIILCHVVYTQRDRHRLWSLLARHLAPGGRIVVANPDTKNTGRLLRDHVRHAGALSLLRPSLLAVWAFDLAIALNSAFRVYDFPDQETTLAEVRRHGFETDGGVARCYGGHALGIDLLFCLKLQESGVRRADVQCREWPTTRKTDSDLS